MRRDDYAEPAVRTEAGLGALADGDIVSRRWTTWRRFCRVPEFREEHCLSSRCRSLTLFPLTVDRTTELDRD